MQRLRVPVGFLALWSITAFAQQTTAKQSIGSVSSRAAVLDGQIEVKGSRTELLSDAHITASRKGALVQLSRGGEVLVCPNGQLRLQKNKSSGSLTVGLDRGRINLQTRAQISDVILTPDLRISFATPGDLNFKLGVNPNGDTCIQSEGMSAPLIVVRDGFSEATSHLSPGQHLLYQHGSVRNAVADDSACGCLAPYTGGHVNHPQDGGIGSIQVGAAYSNADSDEVSQRIAGASFYTTLDLYKGLGVEAKVSLLNFQTPQDFGEETYQAGIRYAPAFARFRPYVRGLGGAGHTSTQENYVLSRVPHVNQTFGVISAGAGLDIQFDHKINVRIVDFEKQFWPGFSPHGLTPSLVSFGIAYRLH